MPTSLKLLQRSHASAESLLVHRGHLAYHSLRFVPPFFAVGGDEQVFGDGDWRYPQTAPAAFGHCSRNRAVEASHDRQQRQQEQLPEQEQPQQQQRGRQKRVQQQSRSAQHPSGAGQQKRKRDKEQPAETAATTCLARPRTRSTTALQRLAGDGPTAGPPTARQQL